MLNKKTYLKFAKKFIYSLSREQCYEYRRAGYLDVIFIEEFLGTILKHIKNTRANTQKREEIQSLIEIDYPESWPTITHLSWDRFPVQPFEPEAVDEWESDDEVWAEIEAHYLKTSSKIFMF